MVTKEQAMRAAQGTIFHHVGLRNADGTPLRVRVMGKCKTWKTRPAEFRLPIKYGMYQASYITEGDAANWCTTDVEAIIHREQA